VNSFTVVLDFDRRDDDAQPIMDAILQIRGVLRVSPNISSIDTHIAESRANTAAAQRLIDVADELLGRKKP
jgi:hypothetical protein